jgi:hypothetical protein
MLTVVRHVLETLQADAGNIPQSGHDHFIADVGPSSAASLLDGI